MSKDIEKGQKKGSAGLKLTAVASKGSLTMSGHVNACAQPVPSISGKIFEKGAAAPSPCFATSAEAYKTKTIYYNY
jgi:hypothetical protein